MKLGPPALAVAWEIWRRHRAILIGACVAVVLGAITSRLTGPQHPWTSLVQSVAYTVLAGILLLIFGAFHFTEGRKKGGFGSFPTRLFHLPVSTGWLVAWPMAYGALAIVVVYVSAALLVFPPLDQHLPIAWPCLYLVSGFVQFQMIIWSFPENRYFKLLCLSVVATVILTGWMFFLPHVVAGTLSEFDYTGDPAIFLRKFMVAVGLTVPCAYLVSVHGVRRQRTGLQGNTRWFIRTCDALTQSCFRRSKAFRSTSGAIFWQEWRQTGLVLPVSVCVLLGMIFLPMIFSDPLGISGTRMVIVSLVLCPLVFGLIIGRGFGKPGFWSPTLAMTPFHAVRPVTTGAWVMSKMKVAALSVLLTWLIVLVVGSLWFIYYGDYRAFDGELEKLRASSSSMTRWLIFILGPISLILLSWRFLTGGLATGMSGHKAWFYLHNSLITGLILTGLIVLITQSDNPTGRTELRRFWPDVYAWPWILGAAVLVKFSLAAVLWSKVERRKLWERKSVACYYVVWVAATAVPLGVMMTIVSPWLKWSLVLLALLWIPLCGPALAMLSLQANRSRG